jgi:enoyl-CoA hydratase/carnithine racemase
MRIAHNDVGVAQSHGAETSVLYSVADHVAVLSLNRPERMNSISRPMLDQLAACLLRAESDPEVRVVLLTRQGSYFCVGLDLVSAGDDRDIGPNAAMSPSLDLRNAPPTILNRVACNCVA